MSSLFSIIGSAPKGLIGLCESTIGAHPLALWAAENGVPQSVRSTNATSMFIVDRIDLANALSAASKGKGYGTEVMGELSATERDEFALFSRQLRNDLPPLTSDNLALCFIFE